MQDVAYQGLCCHGNRPTVFTQAQGIATDLWGAPRLQALTWEDDRGFSPIAVDFWNQPLPAQPITASRLEKWLQAATCVVHLLPCGIHCGKPECLDEVAATAHTVPSVCLGPEQPAGSCHFPLGRLADAVCQSLQH